MSLIPREMVKWLQTLDLSVIIKNPRRDFANGFVIAEIFSRYFPTEITTRSFDKGTSHAAKTQNWEYLNNFLRKKEVPVTPKMIDDTMNLRPEGTQQMLDTIYTFLTRRTAPVRPQLRQTTIPPYAQPTTSSLIRSHEEDVKKSDTKTVSQEAQQIIQQHHEQRLKERETNKERFNIKHKPKGIPKQMTPKVESSTVGFRGAEVRPLNKKLPGASPATSGPTTQPPPQERSLSANLSSPSVPETASEIKEIPQETPAEPTTTVTSILNQCISETIPSCSHPQTTTVSDTTAVPTPMSYLAEHVKEVDDEELDAFSKQVLSQMPMICDIIAARPSQFFAISSLVLSLLTETRGQNDIDRFTMVTAILEQLGDGLAVSNPVTAQTHLFSILPSLIPLISSGPFRRVYYLVSAIRAFALSTEGHHTILTAIKKAMPATSFVRVMMCYYTPCSPPAPSCSEEPLHELVMRTVESGLSMTSANSRSCALQLIGLSITDNASLFSSLFPRVASLVRDPWWRARSLACADCSFFLPLFLEQLLSPQTPSATVRTASESSSTPAAPATAAEAAEEQLLLCIDSVATGLSDAMVEVRAIVANILLQIVYRIVELCPTFLPAYAPPDAPESTIPPSVTSALADLRRRIVNSCTALPLDIVAQLFSTTSTQLPSGDPPAVLGGCTRNEAAYLTDMCLLAAAEEVAAEQGEPAGNPDLSVLMSIPPPHMLLIRHCLCPALSHIAENREQLQADTAASGDTINAELEALTEAAHAQETVYIGAVSRVAPLLGEALLVAESAADAAEVVEAIASCFPEQAKAKYTTATSQQTDMVTEALEKVKTIMLMPSAEEQIKEVYIRLYRSIRQIPALADIANHAIQTLPPYLQKSINEEQPQEQ